MCTRLEHCEVGWNVVDIFDCEICLEQGSTKLEARLQLSGADLAQVIQGNGVLVAYVFDGLVLQGVSIVAQGFQRRKNVSVAA